MMDLEALKAKAAAMPPSPGVYLMKDARGKVIYIGKAKSLPKRVVTYFQKSPTSVRTARMVAQVKDVEYILTDTEKEALILENNLIKKHKPKYNIILRDDKTYPSLRLTIQEPFPRLEVVRRIKRDGAVYFGPFSSATAMRQTMRLIRRIFPIRQCRRPDVTAVERPCLNYQLGRCLGPCAGHVSEQEYRSMVEEVMLFFQGKNQKLTQVLKTKMTEAAARLDFEAAARYRDRLNDVERTLEKQKVVSVDSKDQDVFGLTGDRGQMLAVILFIRGGALLGRRTIPLGGGAEPPGQVLETLLGQYYGHDNPIPDEILLPVHIEYLDVLLDWLKDKRGRAVKVLCPSRGPRKKLIDLAAQNAATALTEKLRAADLGADTLMELQKKLHLPNPPHRIEGFDMSTLRGDSPVGAMVVLEDGQWRKSDYRRYKIKTASGEDDYAMMSEVLRRRLVREDMPRPDLLLLDGGRGQLGVALTVIKDLGLADPPPLAGLAKGREREADRVWLPGRKNPIDFRADAPGLLLLMRVRDEAHRYVQSYHHQVRSKSGARSILEDIPGIGPARRKALLTHFGSLEAVQTATVEDLSAVQGLKRDAAEAVFDFFHPDHSDKPA